jgi:hypothetical protein
MRLPGLSAERFESLTWSAHMLTRTSTESGRAQTDSTSAGLRGSDEECGGSQRGQSRAVVVYSRFDRHGHKEEQTRH